MRAYSRALNTLNTHSVQTHTHTHTHTFCGSNVEEERDGRVSEENCECVSEGVWIGLTLVQEYFATWWSLTQSLIHSLTHSLTQLTHSLTQLTQLTHSLTHSTHSLNSLTHTD